MIIVHNKLSTCINDTFPLWIKLALEYIEVVFSWFTVYISGWNAASGSRGIHKNDGEYVQIYIQFMCHLLKNDEEYVRIYIKFVCHLLKYYGDYVRIYINFVCHLLYSCVDFIYRGDIGMLVALLG